MTQEPAYQRVSSLVSSNNSCMTEIEVRTAHRIGAALLKQSKEKMRDKQQNLGKAEA